MASRTLWWCAPQIACTVITPPALPAGMHDANHQESDLPPPAGAPESGAGALAAAGAPLDVAAGALAPRPCAGDLRCRVAPTLAEIAAGGARGEESASPNIPASACPEGARRVVYPGIAAQRLCGRNSWCRGWT